MPHSSRRDPRTLSRRTFLRGAGVAMALPLLDAMRPAFAAERRRTSRGGWWPIETNMGILPQFFFPEGAGKDYTPTPVSGAAGRVSRTSSRCSLGSAIRG